jgi:hypothetical protein
MAGGELRSMGSMEDRERTRNHDEDEEESSVEAAEGSIGELDEDEEESGGAPIYCTRCGSHYVRPSSRRNLLDVLCGLVFIKTYRCHSCYRRFHTFIPPGTNVKRWHPGD